MWRADALRIGDFFFARLCVDRSSHPPRERFVCVRLVRIVALVIVLAAVYFAQYLFDTTSLADFFPVWLVRWWPALGAMSRWLPEDLIELATWLMVLGLLSFGLLAPWWQGERGRVYRRLRRGRVIFRVWWWVAQGLLVLAMVGTGVVLWMGVRGSAEIWVIAAWLSSLVIYMLGGVIANRLRPPVVYGDNYLETVRPWDSWPYWLVLLVIFAVLYVYRLLEMPLRVDALSARVGLAAQSWIRDGQMPALAASASDFPLPTLATVALFRFGLRDNLLSLRVAGLVTALCLLSTVWLFATELFRRVPVYGLYGEVLEDDGRWIALMAMIVVGISLPTLHWARMPYVLEGVTLGMLALWALLRGLRRDRPALLGVSGIALGWSVYYGAIGLGIGFVALLVWCGVLLLESSWLSGKFILPPRGGEQVPVQRGVGWRGFGFWSVGIIVAIAPLLARWLVVPGALATHWSWPGSVLVREGSMLLAWRERLELALLGLNHLPDATGLIAYAAPFASVLLAPLLVLALGALLLNIDSLVGWTLSTWLLVGVVAAGLTVPVVPAWAAMILLLPVAGMAIAFVLDRLRLLIMTNAGTWTLQATVYLALGVVVAAGFLNWIDYYAVAQHDSDLPSAVGRALRSADGRTVVMVSANVPLEVTRDDPVVALLAASHTDIAEIVVVNGREWPELSPSSRLLLAPGDSALQGAIEDAYPNGSMTVMRDLNANPLLFVYDLIETATVEE